MFSAIVFLVGSTDASSYELDTQSSVPIMLRRDAVEDTSPAVLSGGSENAACDDACRQSSGCSRCSTTVISVDDTGMESASSRAAFHVDSQTCSESVPLAECDEVAMTSEAKLALSVTDDDMLLYDEPSINDTGRKQSSLSFLP